MTTQQLNQIETELKKRGYRNLTRNLIDNESYAWFKSFGKEWDEDGHVVSGYQIAFRVWDNTKYKLPEHSAYGFDFYTTPLGIDGRMDFTSNWEPVGDIATFETIARDFNNLIRKYTS